MTNLLTKIKRRITRPLYIDLDQDYRNSIFLAGCGRSGTTWISNIINYKNEYRYIFEPFHPQKVDISNKFGNRKYLRAENIDREFIETAEVILTGKIRNFWTDNFNARLFCDKRLIKEIRANLFLKWMHTNFPGMPIILLIRHPYATAVSHFNFNLKVELKDFLLQDELMDDFLNPFKNEIERACQASEFEKHIFIWCIENYVPLRQFKRNEIHVAFYENFCVEPRKEIERLFSYLGGKFDEKVLVKLKRPAPLARNWSAILKGTSLTDSWREHLTTEQIKRAKEIVKLFGLDVIYPDETSIPNIENTYAIMGS